jgi:hypothetical protein
MGSSRICVLVTNIDLEEFKGHSEYDYIVSDDLSDESGEEVIEECMRLIGESYRASLISEVVVLMRHKGLGSCVHRRRQEILQEQLSLVFAQVGADVERSESAPDRAFVRIPPTLREEI